MREDGIVSASGESIGEAPMGEMRQKRERIGEYMYQLMEILEKEK